ncbi:hypothetical protein C8T65DRAFT_262358 [Cerioporus squamosus]|nr:hypothetical protein C8T65DRAFT_262358 [Cerioporus squamosus]
MTTLIQLPHIPLEVAENIIDRLSGDVRSLHSCSLTCQRWHPRARYHLMTSIRIQSRQDHSSICDYFSSNSGLACFVRRVSIIPADTEDNPLFLVEAVPVLFLSRLPNLRSYSIQKPVMDTTLSGISFHATTLTCVKTYLHVEELHLGPLALHTSAELARFLIALPQLRRLQCTRLLIADRRNLWARNTFPAWIHDRCSRLSEVIVRRTLGTI